MKSPSISPATASSMRAALALTLVLTGVFLALGFCSHARINLHLAWTFAGVAACMGFWQWALFQRSGPKVPRLAWEFAVVRAHYVQALVQFSIYAYWGYTGEMSMTRRR